MFIFYKSFIQPLINLIFPNQCLFCGTNLTNWSCICSECSCSLELISSDFCKRCGAPLAAVSTASDCSQCREFDFQFRRNESLGIYDGKIKELIHQLKFNRRLSLAPYFADLIVLHKVDYIRKHQLLVPVPLNRSRYSERGFNQSYLLCRSIAKRVSMWFNGEVLTRKGSSLPQSEMPSLEKRLSNLNDRFIARPKKAFLIQGKDVLLIDDVITTGVTVSECARALYSKGARSVDVLTIARALRER